MINKTFFFALALSVAPYAFAGELENAASGNFSTSLPAVSGQLPQSLSEQMQPAQYRETGVAGDVAVISTPTLLANDGKKVLFAFLDTKEENQLFADRWTAILKSAGITPLAATWKDGMSTLSYDAGGMAIRRFISDDLVYDGTNEAAIMADMRSVEAKMQESGLKVFADFRVKLDFFRPCYALYYLAAPSENEDHEVLLRVLKPGDEINYGLLEKGHVNVIRKDSKYVAAYIGPLIGVVYKGSMTEEGINKKVADSVSYLTSNGKKMIGSNVVKLKQEKPSDLAYAAEIYFFQ